MSAHTGDPNFYRDPIEAACDEVLHAAADVSRRYWLTMQYQCDRCAHRIVFYLEQGCEGPREREVAPPQAWEHMRAKAPFPLPRTVPATNSGRYVLPVPFIAAGCPKCQPKAPWRPNGGILQHVDWKQDRRVDTTEPPADAGRFHYPVDWSADQACGEPVLPNASAIR